MITTLHYVGERPKLEGETENICVRTRKRKGTTAVVLMATSCTTSLGGESEGLHGHKHAGDEGCSGFLLTDDDVYYNIC